MILNVEEACVSASPPALRELQVGRKYRACVKSVLNGGTYDVVISRILDSRR